MNKPRKQYDAADWHLDEDFVKLGLPEQHTAHHILYFMRWLHEQGALTRGFWDEVVEPGEPQVFPEDVSSWGDIAFLDYMVREDMRPFVEAYYAAQSGRLYLADYAGTLQGGLPTMYHIPFHDEGYAKLKPVLDARYEEWRSNLAVTREARGGQEDGGLDVPAQRAQCLACLFLLLTCLAVAVPAVFFLMRLSRKLGPAGGSAGNVEAVLATVFLLAAAWAVWKVSRKKSG